MITDITDVSDKDVIEAAMRSVGGHVGIGSVVVTNPDTILCFDTPEQLMKCVAVLRQLYPGHLLADAVKCDGNHGGPVCADPHCWQRDEPWPWPNTNHCDGNHAPPACGAADCLHSKVPVVMHPKADECGSEPGLRGVLEMLYDVAFQDGESPDAQRVQRKELAVELAFRTLATPEQRAEPQRLHQAVWPSVASGFPCPACNGTGIQPPGFLDPSKAWP